jgi:hypothetical protein
LIVGGRGGADEFGFLRPTASAAAEDVRSAGIEGAGIVGVRADDQRIAIGVD